MRPATCLVLLLLFTLGFSGCAPTRIIGPAGQPVGTITHVVIMWMYDPGDDTAKDEVLDTARKLQAIPGVLSVSAGTMVKSDRPVVDNSYDVGFVMTFKDQAAMQDYLANPIHADLKKNVLDRYVERYKVYDFASK